MFKIPTLKELVERSRNAFRAHLPGSDAWLWPNNIYVSAKVMGGSVHELFGFADYIARQRFALFADSENLDYHGEELGLARRPAGPARGKVTITVTAAATTEAGALFRRTDGIELRSTGAASRADAGTLTVDAVATADGKTTNTAAGAPLDVVSGVTTAGTALAAVALDGVAGGEDVEDDESFRARILFRKRNPPHGGSAADYVMWASAVSGVTRVFVERLWAGTGTVRVFVLMDDLYNNGIPPVGEVARVRDYIELVRPAGAAVTVAAPTAVPVNISIAGLAPDTTATRDAVVTELRAAFRRLSRVAGTDARHGGMPYLATPEAFSRSWVWQAVANATGEERHQILTPAADVTLSAGQIATLGTVSFVA